MDSGANADLFSQRTDWLEKGRGEDSLALSFESVPDEVVQTQRETVIEQSTGFAKSSEGDTGTSAPLGNVEFYDLFLAKAQSLCNDSQRTPDQLAEAMGLKKTQLDIWLKKPEFWIRKGVCPGLGICRIPGDNGKNHRRYRMRLEALYCDIDDFCQVFLPEWEKEQLACGERKRRRSSSLSVS